MPRKPEDIQDLFDDWKSLSREVRGAISHVAISAGVGAAVGILLILGLDDAIRNGLTASIRRLRRRRR